MGFLDVNRPKKPKRVCLNHHHAKNPKRQALACSLPTPPPELVLKHRIPPSIESLPREVLEIIFIESKNIHLPQVSLDIARKLSMSEYLKHQLILSCLSEENELPCDVIAQWHFIDVSLLDNMCIRGFCGRHKFVPSNIEIRGDLDLVSYMVTHGCSVEVPEETYLKLLGDSRLEAVQALIDRKAPCDHRSVVKALEISDSELALALIGLCKDLKTQSKILFETAQRANIPSVTQGLLEMLETQ